MKKPYPASTIQNVINSAIYHLNLRDHSEYELRKKLEAKTENKAWVDTVLEQMKGYGYLKSDHAFSLHFCELAFNSQYGRKYIQQKLKTKGIDELTIEQGISETMQRMNVCEQSMINTRLARFKDFSTTSAEKVVNDLLKRGFSMDDISRGISEHSASDTLLTKAQIKGKNANLEAEVLKLAKKLKGRSLIAQELKMKHVDISELDTVLDELIESGEIDFYYNCQLALAKKRYDLTDFKEKSKAYGYLSSKGFSGDEIKEAINIELEE
ncbi:RecX family transcriptional regulator [Photobacterium leiognathi]|uniref:RecX family transcriptional regulator n=1 Tax=Photobacterium leiognathi TaxID=553611 RepID=UPI002981926D|nr:RecX family transcriptional regulator [Photobacterium leiognathi]